MPILEYSAASLIVSVTFSYIGRANAEKSNNEFADTVDFILSNAEANESNY